MCNPYRINQAAIIGLFRVYWALAGFKRGAA
jgi:hypothetical protein